MTQRAWCTVAALLLGVVLLGCDDEPEPKFADPTESPSTSEPTTEPSSPSPTPKPMSPEQTVRAWVKAYNEGTRTGDYAAYDRITDPGCTSCEGYVGPEQEVYTNGGRIETRGWSIKSLKARKDPGPPIIVDVAMVLFGGSTIPRAGAEPIRYGVSRSIMEFHVEQNARGVSVVTFLGFVS